VIYFTITTVKPMKSIRGFTACVRAMTLTDGDVILFTTDVSDD